MFFWYRLAWVVVTVLMTNSAAYAQRDKKENFLTLECGTMPNLMVALPNIGGALCSTP